MSAVIDEKGRRTEYEYDLFGNLVNIKYHDNTNESFAYDVEGRNIETTDRLGRSITMTYDGLDNLLTKAYLNGAKISYSYDAKGRLTELKGINGGITKYEYDECGRVIKTINAKGKETKCSYDEAGNLTSYTDFAGITTTYTYDENDRVTSKELSKGSDKESINYTYTIDGKLLSVTDKNGTMTYAYDLMDGLTSRKTYDGKEIRYSYDDALRMVEISTDYGKTTYDYDILDRLTRVVSHDGTATLYEYDANGNRTAVKYEGGTTTTYEYDDLNRLIKEETIDKDSNIIAQYLYTLGLAGERVKVEEYDADGLDRTVEYEYDELYRLVKETITDSSGSKTTRYSYDKNSNRTLKDENGIKTSYGYNELNQLILEGSKYYAYDDNGNLVKVSLDGALLAEYSYDMEDRLVKALVVGEGKTITEEYLYDYTGRRIAKITDGKVVNYLVDTSGMLSHVLAEYDSEDNLLVYYTRGADLISQDRDGEKHYYLYDGHNSVRMLVDEEGNVSDRYTYDAFGNLIDSTGSTENTYLYCGEEYNETTGLYYLRARYMDPSNGTFISMDKYQGSIDDPISIHKYLYANANPVMNSDPTGYYSTLVDAAGALSIMGILSEMATISISFALSIYSFLKVVEIITYVPSVIQNLLDTSEDLVDGSSSIGDIANGIRDDVISEAKDGDSEIPDVDYPGNNPEKAPGEEWEWKGKGEPGSREGNWHNEETGESLHPDLEHPTEGKGIGPHWDYKSPDGKWYRVFPDGSIVPK